MPTATPTATEKATAAATAIVLSIFLARSLRSMHTHAETEREGEEVEKRGGEETDRHIPAASANVCVFIMYFNYAILFN